VVLLVHGSVTGGQMTWSRQAPLAERWRLVVVDRRGYFPNPPVEREDFDVDAEDIAGLLRGDAHLVGHSYGGLVSLLAAAKRPTAVRSLTVIEPPVFNLSGHDPNVAAFIRHVQKCRRRSGDDPEAFLRGFLTILGFPADLPSPLPPEMEQQARLLLTIRNPAEARVPYDDLRRAPFPKLVVSGADSEFFGAMCDALAEALGAQRAVIPESGHNVPRAGGAFNETLESFLLAAETAERAGE
jgi:pimeloyl-ACP methyl ester carboxylesterase